MSDWLQGVDLSSLVRRKSQSCIENSQAVRPEWRGRGLARRAMERPRPMVVVGSRLVEQLGGPNGRSELLCNPSGEAGCLWDLFPGVRVGWRHHRAEGLVGQAELVDRAPDITVVSLGVGMSSCIT